MDYRKLGPFFCLLFSILKISLGDLMDGRRIAGPVDIVLRKFELCPKKIAGENGLRFTNMRNFNSKGKPWLFIVNANVTLDFYLNDDITGLLSMAQWSQRGGWKVGAHKMKFTQLCSGLSTYGREIANTFSEQVYGKSKHCPLSPVNGYLRNVTINTKYLYLKEFVYGRWRCDVFMVHEPTKVTKACLRFTSDIVPAQT